MLTYAAFTTVAIIWLVYRLLQFLGIPVWRIVSTLGLQVPHTTKVSIDDIASTGITLRWENEPSETTYKASSPISHYILYLNNTKVGAFPNVATSLYTCCSLTGLSPQTQYQFDFVTVNKHGFMNKVPSIYVMTKSETEMTEYRHLTMNVEDNEIASLRTPNFPADAKWRKSQITTPVDFPTSYASLTSLQDLEDFSITDLKKILICAQEDLHDVLQQQSSILQDFRESEIQLQLELDNLKAQWSHEIDLRKSLKSSIKSLENSKLLYDLKRGKLEKNIDQVKDKVKRMKNDMSKWESEQKNQLKEDVLAEKYREQKRQILQGIETATVKIRELQREVSAQEEENKRLVLTKKSLDANNSSAHLGAANSSTKKDTQKETYAPLSLNSVLKKLNDYTLEKSGLLTSAGQEFLNSLSENSCVTSQIKEEVNKDLELENQWRIQKAKLRKRIDLLEKKWNELDMNNRHIIANLAAQPYTVTSTAQVSAPASGGTPQLVLHDPHTYVDADSQHQQQPFGTASYRAGAADSSTFSNWSLQQEHPQVQDHQQSQHVTYGSEDQNFDYDNAKHLLSGLQNMISEADYQTTNSSTSKLYTTDQLDSYWNKNTSPDMFENPRNRDVSFGSTSVPLLSPPVIYQRDSLSQKSQTTQNTLASLNDAAPSMLAPDSIFLESDQVTNDEKATPVALNDDAVSFASTPKADLATTPPIRILREDGDLATDGAFHSTNFNSIWSNPNTGTTSSFHESTKLDTPKSGHIRSNSRGSWGLPQFMHRSPVSSTSDTKSTHESASSPRQNGDSKEKDHQFGNGRRMSKLLSRSGMNHLFKLPSHDTS